jgi:hypothetical protein
MANMEQHDRVNSTEARAGATPHVGRYVLVISTILIVVAFAALLMIWA